MLCLFMTAVTYTDMQPRSQELYSRFFLYFDDAVKESLDEHLYKIIEIW